MPMLRAWGEAIRLRLIDDWQRAGRFWSVRLSAAGALFSFVGAAFPSFMLDMWNSLPSDLRDMLPEHASRVLAALFFAGAIAARLFKQKGKSDDE